MIKIITMENFSFDKDYILENERVLLRQLTIEDIEHLTYFSMNEPELWKYSMQQANGLENLKKYIVTALENKQNKTEYPFIIFDKQTQQYAGSTRFYDIQLKHQMLQLGYTWIGKNFQGTGLNKHCKFLLLQFAFEQMNMHRVEFRADNENEKSKAAMKSIGCDDWKSTVKENLRNKLK